VNVRILVVGAGMMGTAIAHDLTRRDDIDEVIVGDRELGRARALVERLASTRATAVQLDATAPRAVREAMDGCTAVISAVPYFLNAALARAAIDASAHFCDLGGNPEVVDAEFALDGDAAAAGVTIVPDCGLAPGLANILAAGAVRQLDHAKRVRLRVGGLPQQPRPPLDYQIVFSPYGLINEYAEPCSVVRGGVRQEVPPLTEIEPMAFDAPFDALEAFHTSGGSSTLPRTLANQVEDLDYKTIRYPGHARIVKALLDLGLFDSAPREVGDVEASPREMVAGLFAERMSFGEPDVVLLRVEATGTLSGRPTTVRYELVDRFDPETGLSAMMRCTGFPAAAVAHLLACGRIDRPGAHPQELVVPVDAYVGSLRERGLAIEHTVGPATS